MISDISAYLSIDHDIFDIQEMTQMSNPGNHYRRTRKMDLERTGKINCSRCKFHQCENDGHRARPDRHKNHRGTRRESRIRKNQKDLYLE